MIEGLDEVYQFAIRYGGAGYIFTQEHDADIMHSSATINLNLLDSLVKTKGMGRKVPKIFTLLLHVHIRPIFKRM